MARDGRAGGPDPKLDDTAKDDKGAPLEEPSEPLKAETLPGGALTLDSCSPADAGADRLSGTSSRTGLECHYPDSSDALVGAKLDDGLERAKGGSPNFSSSVDPFEFSGLFQVGSPKVLPPPAPLGEEAVANCGHPNPPLRLGLPVKQG